MSEIDTALTELAAVLEADAAAFAKGHDADDMSWLPDWFMGQLAAMDAQDGALEQQFDRLRKQQAAKRRALWWKWGQQFQARVHQDLQGAKRKSVDYAFGRAGIRVVPARTKFIVDDEAVAAAFALENCPDAVRVVPVKAKLYEYMQSKGGAVLPGCRTETTEAREQFFPRPFEKGEDDVSEGDQDEK